METSAFFIFFMISLSEKTQFLGRLIFFAILFLKFIILIKLLLFKISLPNFFLKIAG
jgi:hypothetical protein